MPTAKIKAKNDQPAATIVYHELGSGPPLVLLHGFPLDGTMWADVAEILSQQWRVIIPDLRGFGQSPWPETQPPQTGDDVTGDKVTWTVAAMADDVEALLAAIQIDGPIVLAGLSMGGYIALQFALRHPARLRGLILADTRAAADTAEAQAGRRKMAERVLAEGPAFVAEAMIPKLFAPDTFQRCPELIAEYHELILRTNPRTIAAAAIAMGARPDVTNDLEQIHVPTLCIAGTDDAISPPKEMLAWSAELTRGRFVEIPGAGHMSPVEQPDSFAAALNAWAEESELV
jgi:pimeloyl-ACP methyl ester carboxylesterase